MSRPGIYAEIVAFTRTLCATPVDEVDEFEAIDDLRHDDRFREACEDAVRAKIEEGHPIRITEMNVHVMWTYPNPAYAGPDVLFGDPPPEFITEKGMVSW